VADFGLSKTINSTIGLQSKSNIDGFTPIYAAPEIILSQKWSFPADVYSYGITLWQLMTGKMPFADQMALNQMLLMNIIAMQGKRPDIPPDMPPRLSRLIKQCWDGDFQKRPTFDEAAEQLEQLV